MGKIFKDKEQVAEEVVEEATEQVWVCADCGNDLPAAPPAACPRCGSTAANPK